MHRDVPTHSTKGHQTEEVCGISLFLEEDTAAWFGELMKNFAAAVKRQGEQCVGRERERERVPGGQPLILLGPRVLRDVRGDTGD